jgi:hypothetical protein
MENIPLIMKIRSTQGNDGRWSFAIAVGCLLFLLISRAALHV